MVVFGMVALNILGCQQPTKIIGSKKSHEIVFGTRKIIEFLVVQAG